MDDLNTKISHVAELLEAIMDTNLPPANKLPPTILGIAGQMKPGTSKQGCVSKIISRMETETSFPVEPLPDGSENEFNKVIRIIVEEILDELNLRANIQVAMPPGSIQIVGQCTTPAGPMAITASNLATASGTGQIM